MYIGYVASADLLQLPHCDDINNGALRIFAF